jgi:uncharacterized zinc-type alcohol dehydrogenase-like protein
MTNTVRAIGATAEASPLEAIDIVRRTPEANDVRIAITHSGICHSDIHTVRGEWGERPYPVVPGHEILGTVLEVGSGVTRFTVGQTVGVGVIVDSCGTCPECVAHLENYCTGTGPRFTYADPEPQMPGAFTYGGYAQEIVTAERFVYRIPEGLDLAGVAPLLCAGITVFSPLKHWGAGPGKTVAVAGIGGLGHLAVKFAHALGAHTVAITSSEDKRDLCLKLGADEVLVSSDPAAMAASDSRFDIIISTLPSDHDMNPYISLLTLDGTYVVVGAVNDLTRPLTLPGLMMRRRSIGGSMIGGTVETQEMLDFCGKHGITADVEVVKADYVNQAYDRVVAGDVAFRFVIDATTI